MSVVSDRPGFSGGGGKPSSDAEPRRGRVRDLPHALWRRWNDAELFSAPPRSEWPLPLRRARTVGFALLAIQLIVLGVWSTVLVHRYSTTVDFSAYEQAAYLLGHGHLNPYSTVLKMPFWHNDSEFILIPLGVILRAFPYAVTLPLLQDIAIVAAEAVALAWICEIVADRNRRESTSTTTSVALVGLAVVLLISNPWVPWATSFDFHLEPFLTLFTLGAARDLHRGRRSAWIWVALCLLSSAVGASYIGAVGLSAALTARRRWRRGLLVTVIGFGYLILLEATHGANVSALDQYSYIVTGQPGVFVTHVKVGTIVKSALEHPSRVVNALWMNRTNIWGNISPTGVIGILWLPLTVPILLILGEASFGQGGMNFSLPGFQNVTLEPLITVGTIALLAMLAPRIARLTGRWRGWVLPSIGAVLVANSLVWSIVWLPQISKNWLLVTPAGANVLSDLHKEIGPNDEVVASQGIAGNFSARASIFPMLASRINVPVSSRKIWFILSATQGLETASIPGIYEDIAALNAIPSVHLVVDSQHIFAFEWTPPKSLHRFKLKTGQSIPGWILAGTSGRSARTTVKSAWSASSTSKPGYVIDQGYWAAPSGVYRGTVNLSVSSTAHVEIWNATTSTLLAHTTLGDTHGRRTVHLLATLKHVTPRPVVKGWGIWGMAPTRQPGDNLEIRVWSPGGSNVVKVYSTSLSSAPTTS
jgi:uncharacterized membrane protein